MDEKAEYLIKIKDFPKILKALLEEKVVDKIVGAEAKVNRKTQEVDRFTISPKVYEKAEDVGEDFPLSNLITYGYARTDSAAKYLHAKLEGAKNERVGLIARPCDTRALIELSKIRQVNLDNLFIIGLVDQGMAINVGRSMRKYKDIDTTKIVGEKLTENGITFLMEDGSIKDVDIQASENCSRCIRKEPVIGDIGLTDIGLPLDSDEVILKIYSDKGESILSKAGIDLKQLPDDVKSAHSEKLKSVLEKAEAKRKKDIEEWEKTPQEEKIKALQKCTMCGMCIRGCPVCYCVDCILQKKRKDKTINAESYQLTRIAHVADRCVECGNCFNNCPMSLPLSIYFQSLNESFKKKFKYTPGESAEDIPFRSGKAISEMELKR